MSCPLLGFERRAAGAIEEAEAGVERAREPGGGGQRKLVRGPPEARRRELRLYIVRSMLGDDRGGRRLVPPQSISGHAIRDRLHLVRFEALELRISARAARSSVTRVAETTTCLMYRSVARSERRPLVGGILGEHHVSERPSPFELAAREDRLGEGPCARSVLFCSVS
jgi:hypothetical protein